jgi:hypothetical protein
MKEVMTSSFPDDAFDPSSALKVLVRIQIDPRTTPIDDDWLQVLERLKRGL